MSSKSFSTLDVEADQYLNDVVEFQSSDVQDNQIQERDLPNRDVELSLDERKFLLAVEKGDAATVKDIFTTSNSMRTFNMNCVDPLGRNALLICIENDHSELLDLLLSLPHLELGDALLHAINEENVTAVELLLQTQSERQSKKNLSCLLGNVPSSSFTADITPIILAAHRDNYEILKILLDRGDKIQKPHDLRCGCHDCVLSQKKDSLRHSKSRINAYRALASPSLIALSSRDPILTAFELSWELDRLGRLENEFKTEYEALSLKCQKFARELLEQTRGSDELAIILNHDVGHSTSAISNLSVNDKGETMTLARLKLAIKYKQKQFVAHPHCQQLLASLWYEGMPGFRRMPFVQKSFVIAAYFFSFPVLCLSYVLAPQTTFGKIISKPFIKFVCHTASYILFLALLILSSVRIEFIASNTIDQRISNRGPTPSLLEWVILIFIVGYCWAEIKELWNEGFEGYFSSAWNIYDIGTLSLYLATIVLRVIAYVRVVINGEGDEVQHRGDWSAVDPILVSESIYSLANICSTLKLVNIFTVSPQLGPLQISIGRILVDILRWTTLYILVLIAFAFGMNQLYYFYAQERLNSCKGVGFKLMAPSADVDKYEYCVTRGRRFSDLFEIIQSLFWGGYGLIDLNNFNLEYPHHFTEFTGKLLFGSYSFIAFTVLLNMLIAMMNNSYQIIAEGADVEWKFARSRLWVNYFESGDTLPVPFNLLPNPKTIYRALKMVIDSLFSWREAHKKNKMQSIRRLVRKVNEIESRYQAIMKDLIKRYLMHRQRLIDDSGVTEDDLNEIKGDISSMRFELIEIFQKNGMDTATTQRRNPISSKKARRQGSKRALNRLSRQFDLSSLSNEERKSQDSSSSGEDVSNVRNIWTTMMSKDTFDSIREEEEPQTNNDELPLDPKKLPFDGKVGSIRQVSCEWKHQVETSVSSNLTTTTYVYDGRTDGTEPINDEIRDPEYGNNTNDIDMNANETLTNTGDTIEDKLVTEKEKKITKPQTDKSDNFLKPESNGVKNRAKKKRNDDV